MRNTGGENPADALNRILCGREERYGWEMKLLDDYKRPIVVATVNYPGPEKNDERAQILFMELRSAMRAMVFARTFHGANGAGPFMIGVGDHSAEALKAHAVRIEETHPLGRLFDIDVIDFPYRKLTRRTEVKGRRPCLVCGADVDECGRERRHAHSEVRDKVVQMIEAYAGATQR